MKITELLKLEEVPARVCGIEVDSAANATPPKGLKEAGFLLKIDDNGEINDDFLECLISYKISNVDVLMEIPFSLTQEEKFQKIELGHLLTITANMNASAISFLPPESEDQKDWEAYSVLNEQLVEAYFKKETFDKLLMPLTNYLEYLYMEIILGEEKIKSFKPVDEYVLTKFHSSKIELTDRLKGRIRNKIYEVFNGREDFELQTKRLLSVGYDNVEKYMPGQRELALQQIKDAEIKNSTKEPDPVKAE